MEYAYVDCIFCTFRTALWEKSVPPDRANGPGVSVCGDFLLYCITAYRSTMSSASSFFEGARRPSCPEESTKRYSFSLRHHVFLSAWYLQFSLFSRAGARLQKRFGPDSRTWRKKSDGQSEQVGQIDVFGVGQKSDRKSDRCPANVHCRPVYHNMTNNLWNDNFEYINVEIKIG